MAGNGKLTNCRIFYAKGIPATNVWRVWPARSARAQRLQAGVMMVEVMILVIVEGNIALDSKLSNFQFDKGEARGEESGASEKPMRIRLVAVSVSLLSVAV